MMRITYLVPTTQQERYECLVLCMRREIGEGNSYLYERNVRARDRLSLSRLLASYGMIPRRAHAHHPLFQQGGHRVQSLSTYHERLMCEGV